MELVNNTLRRWSRRLTEAASKFLDTAIELSQADMGNMQLINSENNTLEIVAQLGFNAEFLNYFSTVRLDDECACGRAMRLRKVVTINDVNEDPLFVPYRDIAASAKFRAVQSVPLISKRRNFVGIISTHYRTPQEFSRPYRCINDYFIMGAADVIDWYLAHETKHACPTEPSAA